MNAPPPTKKQAYQKPPPFYEFISLQFHKLINLQMQKHHCFSEFISLQFYKLIHLGIHKCT